VTVEIQGASADGRRFDIESGVRYGNLRRRKAKAKGRKIEFHRKVKCRRLLLRQKDRAPFGVNVLKIVSVDVIGHFSFHRQWRFDCD
jgi:hypothetical protein